MPLFTLPQQFLIRILGVALLVGGAQVLIAAPHGPAPSPDYAVTALRMDLARSQGSWVGRTVRVKAVAGVRCGSWMGGAVPACIEWHPALLAPEAASNDAGLPLLEAPEPALLAALRRLPVAGWLLPGLQRIRWGTLSTYSVRLRAAPARSCAFMPCYKAVLLDAAP